MFNLPVIALVAAVLFASVAEAQSTDQAYLEFQVHRPVRVREASAPMYPQRLHDAGIGGEVIVQFVVNERGEADASSIKVVKTANHDFDTPVRRAVTSASYYAAEIDGRKVRQLVQLTFRFDPTRK